MRRALVIAMVGIACRHDKTTPTPVGTLLVEVKEPTGALAGPFQHTEMKINLFSPAFYNGDGADFIVTYDEASRATVEA